MFLEIKRIRKAFTMKPQRIKKVMNLQKLLMLKWKNNVTAPENEVINLHNIIIISKPRKIGLEVTLSLTNWVCHRFGTQQDSSFQQRPQVATKK